MRELARRIERAIRDDFINHEESTSKYALQIFDDREKVWSRIQELKNEGKTYKEARRQSIEDFIFFLLEDHCVRTSHKNLDGRHKVKHVTVPIQQKPVADVDEDNEDLPTLATKIVTKPESELEEPELEDSEPELEDSEPEINGSKKDSKRKKVEPLPEEELD